MKGRQRYRIVKGIQATGKIVTVTTSAAECARYTQWYSRQGIHNGTVDKFRDMRLRSQYING
jgi:hypothetical protein